MGRGRPAGGGSRAAPPGRGIRVVVLNCCKGTAVIRRPRREHGEGAGGEGSARGGRDAERHLLDRGAVDFARSFYLALAARRPIEYVAAAGEASARPGRRGGVDDAGALPQRGRRAAAGAGVRRARRCGSGGGAEGAARVRREFPPALRGIHYTAAMVDGLPLGKVLALGALLVGAACGAPPSTVQAGGCPSACSPGFTCQDGACLCPSDCELGYACVIRGGVTQCDALPDGAAVPPHAVRGRGGRRADATAGPRTCR